MKTAKFGPSGNENNFYLEHSESVEAPAYLAAMGLNAYEYNFTRGVNVGDVTAREIGNKAKEHGVEISAHAPYYINFGSIDEDAFKMACHYISSSLNKLHVMGGRRLVVHLGSTGGQPRPDALKLIEDRLLELPAALEKKLVSNDYTLFFEVMGRYSQIGNLDEILHFASLDPHYNICVDFGHVNCLLQGGLKDPKEMENVVLKIKSALPPEKHKNFHIHFSKVLFGEKGEIKHLDLDSSEVELDFTPLARLLKKHKMTPWVISESKNKQAQDAAALKKIYDQI